MIKNSNKLLSIAILIFAIFPLIPSKIEGLTVVFFAVISFVFFIQHHRGSRILKVEFLTTITIFLVFLISAILSDDKQLAFKKIETMLSLFVIPLAFYVFLGAEIINYKKLKKNFYFILFTSNILFCFVLAYISTKYTNPKYPTKDANFFRNALNEIPLIGEHPIYSSIFLSIAILMGITLYRRGKDNLRLNFFIVLGHIILISTLLILMSKGVIIALFFSSFILITTKIKTVKINLIIFGSIIALLLILIPSSNNRFKEFFNKASYEFIDTNNSTSIRIGILKCSFYKVLEKPFLGYGLGDVQNELDNCYNQNFFDFPSGKYNSHNQYLFVWLSTGVFGLLIFFVFLGFYFKIAITHKDYLMLSIIVLYSIIFLFENVLSRQSGVILFAFLINFMVWSNCKRNNSIKASNKNIDYFT